MCVFVYTVIFFWITFQNKSKIYDLCAINRGYWMEPIIKFTIQRLERKGRGKECSLLRYLKRCAANISNLLQSSSVKYKEVCNQFLKKNWWRSHHLESWVHSVSWRLFIVNHFRQPIRIRDRLHLLLNLSEHRIVHPVRQNSCSELYCVVGQNLL